MMAENRKSQELASSRFWWKSKFGDGKMLIDVCRLKQFILLISVHVLDMYVLKNVHTQLLYGLIFFYPLEKCIILLYI